VNWEQYNVSKRREVRIKVSNEEARKDRANVSTYQRIRQEGCNEEGWRSKEDGQEEVNA